jgi:glycerol-3-phosphate acyltransferase PlsY
VSWHLLVIPAAYALGSISPAYWAGKLKGVDLRQHGSGNLGATNAGRVLGGKWFFIVFCLDIAKGAGAALAGQALEAPSGHSWLGLAAGAAAILGHSFTCFHGFRGGKAVATSLGVVAALLWKIAAICLGVWFLTWLAGRILFRAGSAAAVGPASVLAAVALPFALFATQPRPFAAGHLPVTIFILGLSVLVIVRHRSNIAKLLKK